MKRVIVTGASGFVGRHALPALLQRGFEVHALDLPGTHLTTSDDLVWHALDLMDPTSVERTVRKISATHLLHFAWFVRHGEYWTAAENLDWVGASLHLLRTFQRSGGGRAVLAGTCAEYDWSAVSGPCIEGETPLGPQSLYGTAKNALRSLLAAVSSTWSMEWAWGRIFLVYGHGEHPARLVPALMQAFLRGQRAACRSANLTRDLMHVEDCARAFAHLVDSPVNGPVNIASGIPVILADVAREIAAQCHAEDRLDLEDQPCSALVPAALVAATGRLRCEVGFTPQFSLRDGIRQVLQQRPG